MNKNTHTQQTGEGNAPRDPYDAGLLRRQVPAVAIDMNMNVQEVK